MVTPKRYVEALTSGTCECDLIGKEGLCRHNRVKGLTRERETGDTGEAADKGGRDWRDAVPSQKAWGWKRQGGSSPRASGGGTALPTPRFRMLQPLEPRENKCLLF